MTNPESQIPNPDDRKAIVRVRGMLNRFGAQTVHEDLDLDVRPGENMGVVRGAGGRPGAQIGRVGGRRQGST